MKKPNERSETVLTTAGEPLVRTLLISTLVVVILMTLILCISFALVGNRYVLPRIGVPAVALVYLGTAYLMLRRRRTRTAAWMLVLFYVFMGFAVLATWGMNAPIGVLFLVFTILLTGVMLGDRYIFRTIAVMCILLILLQIGTDVGWLSPDTSQLDEPSTYLDVGSYCVMFILFAVIAWLAGRRSEQLLKKSLKAEEALQKEKDMLSVRLEEKTREVKEAQLEEMRQLYRFAELGQLGTVLLHDLANNLTALTLDIEDIGSQLQRNESITRAKESIAYLESMVDGVRKQIHDRDKPVVFDAAKAIFETLGPLGPKARRAGVTIEYLPKRLQGFKVKGDPVRFTHIVTILVSNGIEAYFGTKQESKSVVVGAEVVAGMLQVRITDHGNGIKPSVRQDLFKPFASTKPDGLGIGLFMAREMVEKHFNGTLTLEAGTKATTFRLSLPNATRTGAT